MESGTSSNVVSKYIQACLFMFLTESQTILHQLVYGIIGNAYF